MWLRRVVFICVLGPACSLLLAMLLDGRIWADARVELLGRRAADTGKAFERT